MSWGRGLPAGLPEIFLIEQARQRRAVENALPPKSDETTELHQKVYAKLETCKWYYRKLEIERLQAIKMQLIKELRSLKELELLNERDEKMRLRRKHLQENVLDPEIKKIRRDLHRALRNLDAAARKRFNKNHSKRDVIAEYCDFGSQVFAPLTRLGVFPDRNGNKNRVNSHWLNTYDGLVELENTMPESLLKLSVQAPVDMSRTKHGYLKQKFRYYEDLAEVYRAVNEKLLSSRSKQGPLERTSRLVEPRHKVRQRAPTSTYVKVTDREMEVEYAVVRLQSLIRGRAIQDQLFEGVTKHLDLISELRSTHALWKEQRIAFQQIQEAVLKEQSEVQKQIAQTDYIEHIATDLSADTVAALLDTASKELVRLQDEQRLHALSLLMERQRRMREAEEAGNRQKEQHRRDEEDHVFTQATKIHEKTVDDYLADVYLAAMDRTSSDEARSHVIKMAEKLNQIADESLNVERSFTSESESIVIDLVYGFLIPEIRKLEFRQKVAVNPSSTSVGSGILSMSENDNQESQISQIEATLPLLPGPVETNLSVRQKQRRLLVAAHREVCNVVDDVCSHDTANGTDKDYISFVPRRSLPDECPP